MGEKLKSILEMKSAGLGNSPVPGGEARDQLQENEEKMFLRASKGY